MHRFEMGGGRGVVVVHGETEMVAKDERSTSVRGVEDNQDHDTMEAV
jgi:hypothetical protein